MMSVKVWHPFQCPGPTRLSLSIAYGFEKLSHDPSSLTDRISGLVILNQISLQHSPHMRWDTHSKKVIRVVDIIARQQSLRKKKSQPANNAMI